MNFVIYNRSTGEIVQGPSACPTKSFAKLAESFAKNIVLGIAEGDGNGIDHKVVGEEVQLRPMAERLERKAAVDEAMAPPEGVLTDNEKIAETFATLKEQGFALGEAGEAFVRKHSLKPKR